MIICRNISISYEFGQKISRSHICKSCNWLPNANGPMVAYQGTSGGLAIVDGTNKFITMGFIVPCRTNSWNDGDWEVAFLDEVTLIVDFTFLFGVNKGPKNLIF